MGETVHVRTNQLKDSTNLINVKIILQRNRLMWF